MLQACEAVITSDPEISGATIDDNPGVVTRQTVLRSEDTPMAALAADQALARSKPQGALTVLVNGSHFINALEAFVSDQLEASVCILCKPAGVPTHSSPRGPRIWS